MAAPVRPTDGHIPTDTPGDNTDIVDEAVTAEAGSVDTRPEFLTGAGIEGPDVPATPTTKVDTDAGDDEDGADIPPRGLDRQTGGSGWGKKAAVAGVAALAIGGGIAAWLGLKGDSDTVTTVDKTEEPGNPATPSTTPPAAETPPVSEAPIVPPESTPEQQTQGPSGEPEHLRNPSAPIVPPESSPEQAVEAAGDQPKYITFESINQDNVDEASQIMLNNLVGLWTTGDKAYASAMFTPEIIQNDPAFVQKLIDWGNQRRPIYEAPYNKSFDPLSATLVDVVDFSPGTGKAKILAKVRSLDVRKTDPTPTDMSLTLELDFEPTQRVIRDTQTGQSVPRTIQLTSDFHFVNFSYVQ